jgi:PI-3-kinase-related kinase SMG-1
MSLPPEESSTPEQCLSKLTALMKVFTTVLEALGTSFSPSRCPDLTPAYVQSILTRIVHYILSATDITLSEDLLISGNRCVTQLCHCLQNHAMPSATMVAGYIVKQLQMWTGPSNDLAQSLVRLVMQLVEDLQGSLPTQFLQQIFSRDSPVLQLRYSANTKLLNQLVKLYQSVLSIRNIPLLETMYQLIVKDLKEAFQQLELYHSPKRPEGEESLGPVKIQSTIIFDLVVLSQLANTCKAVIEMWSPTPSVFSLLVSRLENLPPTLAITTTTSQAQGRPVCQWAWPH